MVLFSVRLLSAGAEDRFFGLTNLWEIRLTLPAENWQAMSPVERGGGGAVPPDFGRPGPAAFPREYPWSTVTLECAGQRLTNVAIRFKGNSSFSLPRNGLKRPFKLDFNRGAKGRKFFGHEEVLLNNNFNDGTQFREALAYEVFRRAGVAAPRTAFARVLLTIPGERTNAFLGLYTVAEAVEGSFLKACFGTRKGLLTKPERLPGLRYLGPDWSDYVERYEPKTDMKPADAERLMALARLVDLADDQTFARELPGMVNLTNLLRFVAVNAVLANYDSFIGTGHNFYLFQPRDGAPACFIPWDLNEAFGGHPGAGSRREQAEFSVLRPHANSIRLVGRLLDNHEFAAAYRREVVALMDTAFDPQRLREDAARIARVTQDAVFAESPRARNAFQIAALGQVAVGSAGRPGPGREGEPGPRGPGGGPMRDDISFAEWLALRTKNIRAELAGEREGKPPRMMRGPGRPGGPRPPGRPQLGGPGGLVPSPSEPGNGPRRPLEPREVRR